MPQAQLDLAPRVSYVLGALDFASRPLIEQVHGESRPAQFGADSLVVLRRIVWRRDLRYQFDALPLQLVAHATAQRAQRIGRVGQEDREAALGLDRRRRRLRLINRLFELFQNGVDRYAELAHLRRETRGIDVRWIANHVIAFGVIKYMTARALEFFGIIRVMNVGEQNIE